MNDKLQNVTHDRILMRIKDYFQIVGSIFTLLYVGYQFFQRIDRMNDNINRLQTQVLKLQKVIKLSDER